MTVTAHHRPVWDTNSTIGPLLLCRAGVCLSGFPHLDHCAALGHRFDLSAVSAQGIHAAVVPGLFWSEGCQSFRFHRALGAGDDHQSAVGIVGRGNQRAGRDVLAAYGLTRGNYRGKALFSAIIVSPLIMPVLVTAIAMFFFLSKNLRGFFQPVPLPSLSPPGEWAVISFALAIGAAALLFLLGTMGRKGTGPADAHRAWHALRPWAVAALVVSVSFIFMLWVVGATDGREGALFSKANPIPSLPLVSPGLVVAPCGADTPLRGRHTGRQH